MSKTIYPTPLYYKSSVSELEEGGSPQELSEIFIKNQRFIITDSQTPHKRNYLDATYQPIERRGERLNSKKILENTLQGEGRIGNKRLSIKYRNIEDLERDKIREEQIEDIKDDDSNYEGGLIFDKVKEKASLPTEIIISNSVSQRSQSRAGGDGDGLSKYDNVSDIGFSTLKIGSNPLSNVEKEENVSILLSNGRKTLHPTPSHKSNTSENMGNVQKPEILLKNQRLTMTESHTYRNMVDNVDRTERIDRRSARPRHWKIHYKITFGLVINDFLSSILMRN
jgi:hypothetical protein